jgi:hypothetical protein
MLWPPGCGISTVSTPRSLSCAANSRVRSEVAIGSRWPLAITTCLPVRSTSGGSTKGTIAANQDRTGEELGVAQQQGRGDVGPVGEPDRVPGARDDAVLGAGGLDERGELVSAGPQVVLVEDTFAQPAEEPRHTVLEHRAARGQHRGAGNQRPPEAEQVVLVATRAVQQQQGLALESRPPHVRPGTEAGACGAHELPATGSSSTRNAGRTCSICSRLGSSQGGSLRWRPSSSRGSSTSKPGWSVAISKSTPPGSRK